MHGHLNAFFRIHDILAVSQHSDIRNIVTTLSKLYLKLKYPLRYELQWKECQSHIEDCEDNALAVRGRYNRSHLIAPVHCDVLCVRGWVLASSEHREKAMNNSLCYACHQRSVFCIRYHLFYVLGYLSRKII